jgi:hypothetical protein
MKQKHFLSFFIVLLAFAKVAPAQERPAEGPQAQVTAPEGARAEGQQADVGRPQRLTPKLLQRPPAISPERRRILEEEIGKERRERPGPAAPAPAAPPNAVTPPAGDTPTKPGNTPVLMRRTQAAPNLAPQASALVSFLGSAVGQPRGRGGPSVNEPSLGQSGQNVVYSGNWYLARSTDGGLHWSFVDPFADMSDFCCDQDVVHDPGRDLFLWYRQAVGDSAGRNRFVLGASTNGGATWCTYSIRPSTLNGTWTSNQSFDFPRLALSNNYLYIQTGMSGTGVPPTATIRFPLDALATCSGFSFWFWGQVSYWGGPVQGATTVMYFGDHQGASNSFRVYRQPENSTTIFWIDIAIPAWPLEQGEPNGACPSADGLNWCVRSDSVMRGGWVAKGVIGFLWHAAAGNGFPFPYVEVATFNEAPTITYRDRPFIWSNNGAWHYPHVSPNARGDIGVTAFFSTATSFPSPNS